MNETRLGDYTLLNRLGQGGMGEVYQARTSAGEIVALKVLEGKYSAEGEALTRFHREEQVHASLQHPAIVAARGGLEIEGGRAFYAMDYVAGRDLGRLLSEEGAMAPRRAVELVLPLLDALDYAHGLGVVHRDLKPSNVLLDADERPRLADFGLARMVGFSSLTQAGTVLGTPEFMSPEQARGDEAQAPADVYAMGAVLWAMLCGRPPFQAPQPLAVLRMHLDEALPPMPAPAPLPPGLEAIARRALAKEPSQRWPSAAAMAEALRSLDWSATPSVGPSDETLLLSEAAAGAAPRGAADETAPLGPASPSLLETAAWAPPTAPSEPAPPPEREPSRRGLYVGLALITFALTGLGAASLLSERSPPEPPSPSPSSEARQPSSPAATRPSAPALRRVEVDLGGGERVVGGLLELDLAGNRLRLRLDSGQERAFPLDGISGYRYLD